MKTTTGLNWHGNGDNYYSVIVDRKKKRIRRDFIEQAVINRVGIDLLSDDFVASLLTAARKYAAAPLPDESTLLKKRLEKISNDISKLVTLSLDLSDPAPMLREIEKKELERSEITEQLDVFIEREQLKDVYQSISERDVRRLLGGLYDGLTENESEQSIKSMLAAFIDQVTIDPDHRAFTIHYRIAISGGKDGVPKGIRTPVTAVKGRCPRPLDDGDVYFPSLSPVV